MTSLWIVQSYSTSCHSCCQKSEALTSQSQSLFWRWRKQQPTGGGGHINQHQSLQQIITSSTGVSNQCWCIVDKGGIQKKCFNIIGIKHDILQQQQLPPCKLQVLTRIKCVNHVVWGGCKLPIFFLFPVIHRLCVVICSNLYRFLLRESTISSGV